MEGSKKDLISAAKWKWISENKKCNVPGHIVIKVTPKCNLQCVYCYSNGTEKQSEVIDVKMVESMFNQLFEDSKTYNIICCFHGGEPMLYLDTVKEIINVLSKKYYADRILYTIQTNATLINEKNIEYIKNHMNSVGISIDGVGEINDLTRKYGNGAGSFSHLERGIDILNENDVNFGALSVVTMYNVEHLVELIKWCTNKHLRVLGLEPIFFNGRGSECRELAVPVELYRDKMSELLDYCIEYNKSVEDKDRIYIRDFETVAKKILINCESDFMCANVPCGAGTKHLGLNYNGDIYICDSFGGMSDYCIGNLTKESLKDVLSHPLISKFQKRSVEKIEDCKQCDVKQYCLNGCIAKTVLQSGKNDLNVKSKYCEYYYTIAKKIKYLLEEEQLDPHLLIFNFDRFKIQK